MNLVRSTVPRILETLRAVGWEEGIRRLRREPEPLAREFHWICAGWEAAERGEWTAARDWWQPCQEHPELARWAEVGLASLALRSRQGDSFQESWTNAAATASDDRALQATLHLLQGTHRLHGGTLEGVLESYEAAAALWQPDHFCLGRVWDAIGMLYASIDYFQSAMVLFQCALAHKTRCHDRSGLAVTHGQLGRLYADWGEFALAAAHFQQDWELSRDLGDQRGEAQMENLLGQMAIQQGDWDTAATCLDRSIAMAQHQHWDVLEGYARKDRAWGALLLDSAHAVRSPAVEEDLQRAQVCFASLQFSEGMAHVDSVRAMQHRLRGDFDRAEQFAKQAQASFARLQMVAKSASVQLEWFRILRDRQDAEADVIAAVRQAVLTAEQSRRPHLVRAADREWRELDPGGAAQHVLRRVRGIALEQETASLTAAEKVDASVLFFDLQGFTTWSKPLDPGVVLLCVNELLAALRPPLITHQVSMVGFTGDGFLAVARGPRHAHRAVAAALEMYKSLEPINRPRRLLGLPEFRCRVGVHSGEVVFGNVGHYEMLFYSVLGTTVNLAARLQPEARLDAPCISHATWQAVQSDFQFCGPGPRAVELKGLGTCHVWDVVGHQRT